jgi:hypothetical protein
LGEETDGADDCASTGSIASSVARGLEAVSRAKKSTRPRMGVSLEGDVRCGIVVKAFGTLYIKSLIGSSLKLKAA